MNTVITEPDATILNSYIAGQWLRGIGDGHKLVNPSTGVVVAWCSTDGVDFSKALTFARNAGGPALRTLTFSDRAGLLSKIAEVLAIRRDRWFDIARINSGNTKADAAIDIDGAIGTLKYFARLGAALGDAKILVDAPPAKLTRDPNFQAAHLGVPLKGVAVHINAYNFPAWGLWEKAAVSLLAGVPVFSKPATSTAWLAQEMVQCVVESGILPEGSLSILCGPIGDLLEHLQFGDVICFTGSAETGRQIRNHPVVQALGIRINIEADSLNAAILGPDGEAGSPAFDSFVREVVKEMTVKTGQKCTAIRRILVPTSHATAASDAIGAQLQQIKVGDPANPAVTMGPVVNMAQRFAVEQGIRKLTSVAKVVYQPTPPQVNDGNMEKGAFIGPTLLQVGSATDSQLPNELEVFGPVATLIPYGDTGNAISIVERGGGSLAASVFSSDPTFLGEAALGLAPSHGRVLLVDPSIANSHTGHGIVMAACIHGGPGRAGGGEELGGFRGLWFYHQRVALQGSAVTLTNLAQRAVNPTVAQS